MRLICLILIFSFGLLAYYSGRDSATAVLNLDGIAKDNKIFAPDPDTIEIRFEGGKRIFKASDKLYRAEGFYNLNGNPKTILYVDKDRNAQIGTKIDGPDSPLHSLPVGTIIAYNRFGVEPVPSSIQLCADGVWRELKKNQESRIKNR